MVSILSRPLCVKDHTGNTADVIQIQIQIQKKFIATNTLIYISVPGKPQRVCNTFSVF